ncbi:uncharacterized protein J3D65DRAFT_608645 [Phyllosticta citribraziliensis]|uniref:Zn(2)-C6 fungal-type domain-containing protein n=1 Tax=Phyllosticta citribraziliensis TaxID=989973 RepID=A0ABR1MA60_9PEZI
MAERSQPRKRSSYRRNYQACEACKKQKGRCDLGSCDDPQPPCTRCRRARRECVFGPSRYSTKGAKYQANSSEPDQTTLGGSNATASHGLPAPSLPSTASWPSTETTRQASHERQLNTSSSTVETAVPKRLTQDGLKDQLMHTPLKNNVDAMHLLSTAARYESANSDPLGGPDCHHPPMHGTPPEWQGDFATSTASQMKLNHEEILAHWDDESFNTWLHFRLCKDKILNPTECIHLLKYYFNHMNPLYPILSDHYLDPANHWTLLQEEPILCCTIIAIACRYGSLPGHSAFSRRLIAHNSLFRHIQTALSRVIWGLEADAIVGRTLGFIQSLLLLTTWHLEALYLLSDLSEQALPTDFENQAHGKHFFEKSERGLHGTLIAKLSKQSNKMSWMLLGVASTLAQEIGLFDEGPDGINSLPVKSQDTPERFLRVRKFLILHTVESAFRCGRSSSLNHLFSSSLDSRAFDSHINLDQSDRGVHQSLDCIIELARIARLATNTLYATPSQTKAFISNKRYFDIIAHFDQSLESWFTRWQNIPNIPLPFRLQSEIMYHNSRSYFHLIAIQAILERSASLSGPVNNAEQQRSALAANTTAAVSLPEASRDMELVKVIATGSRRVLELTVELHKVGFFRNVSETLLQHIITSAVFGMKVLGLSIEPRSDMVGLLNEVIHIMNTTAVDDLHPGPLYAESLATLLQKVQSVDRPGPDPAPSQQQSVPNSGPVSIPSSSLPQDTNMADQSFRSGGSSMEALEGDFLGGDWSDWLAFQLDPTLSAFETGFLV